MRKLRGRFGCSRCRLVKVSVGDDGSRGWKIHGGWIDGRYGDGLVLLIWWEDDDCTITWPRRKLAFEALP